MSDYIQWKSKHGSKFYLKPMDSNQVFEELQRPFNAARDKEIVDYNYVVDDILQISPPYQSGMAYKPTPSETTRANIDPKGLRAEP